MKGNEVKTILKTNGFQLKQVADRMGVSPQNLDEKLKVKQIVPGFVQKNRPPYPHGRAA